MWDGMSRDGHKIYESHAQRVTVGTSGYHLFHLTLFKLYCMFLLQIMSGRGISWTDEETLVLISVWKEYKIQEQLDGTVRNTAVIRKMADIMHEKGIEKTLDQIKNKLKKLRAQFKKAEDNNRTSGRGRMSCTLAMF